MKKGKLIWDGNKKKIKFVEDLNGNLNLLPLPELIPPSAPTDLGTAFAMSLLAQHEKELLPSTCDSNPSYSAGIDPWKDDGPGLVSVMAIGEKAMKIDTQKDLTEIYKEVEEIGKYYKASIFIEETYNITFRQFLNLQQLLREIKEKSKLNVIKYRRMK